jgi:hypothetical protein
MTTKMMMRAGLLAAITLAAACGGNGSKSGNDGSAPPVGDMAGVITVPPDMLPPPCVANPVSGADFLNACTTAQTGDPAKDYPYYPKLAPNGNLPPTN